jgi:lactoylglutathione lyase
MQLSLVVLKSADIAALSRFYGSVGIAMVREQHGDGPVHYAGQLGQGVIEIYPAKNPSKTTFGLSVASTDAFRAAWLAAGGKASESGPMLIDPDGNALFVSEPNA